ncbi:MAG: FAD-dependent oxidoreductase [archaeon]|nr:FAD-dependent oxidoreductase [archaeon]
MIIVGGASAGLTAAIYSSRFKLKTLVITKDIGGQTLLASKIENYPGFMSINGIELIKKFEEQAHNSGAKFVYNEVVEIKEVEDGFMVKTLNEDYKTKTVILAFGQTPKSLEIPGERRFYGKGLSYSAICDGHLFAKKTVMVVGWGDLAMDAALRLCDIADKVYMSYKTGELLGSWELREKLEAKENLELIPYSQVIEIKGEDKIESVVLKDLWTQKIREIKLDGIFVELGYVVKTDFIRDFVKLDVAGKIIVDKSCSTSRLGIFAAGDITDTQSKQIIISAGEGAMAAISAFKYIHRRYGSIVRAYWS